MTNKKYSAEYARKPVKLIKSMVAKLLPQMETPKFSTQAESDRGANLMNKSLPFMKKSEFFLMGTMGLMKKIDSSAKSKGSDTEDRRTANSDLDDEILQSIESKELYREYSD